MSFTEAEKGFLYALQCGLPLIRRPFEALGAEWGFSEKEAVSFVARLFADGVGRRLGAIFHPKRLGYRSALCAVSLPNEAWAEAVASVVVPHPGVTRCHLRAWPGGLDTLGPGSPRGRTAPNLWFTCTAPARKLDSVLLDLRDRVDPADLVVLPSQTCFKFDEVFDPRTITRCEGSFSRWDEPEAADEHDPDFTETQKAVVRYFQGHVQPTADLFAQAAAAVGIPVDNLLDMLRDWRERVVLRRFALVLRHENIGFKASGMGVWNVPSQLVHCAGRCLAAFPEVTHCYERIPTPGFSYNLFAMIHGEDWEQVSESFIRVSALADVPEGRMLGSLREFKKSDTRFFCEEEATPEPAPPAASLQPMLAER
jgi:DNA-binding Lrp family transcriptional regulator